MHLIISSHVLDCVGYWTKIYLVKKKKKNWYVGTHVPKNIQLLVFESNQLKNRYDIHKLLLIKQRECG